MFPDVGVAEVRDAAIEAIRESLSIYGDQAAALAGALFDQLAARARIRCWLYRAKRHRRCRD